MTTSNLAEAELYAMDTSHDPPPPPAGAWQDRRAVELARVKREHEAKLAQVRRRLSWAPSGYLYDGLRDALIRDDPRWTTGVPEALRELADRGEAHRRGGLWYPGPAPTPTTPKAEETMEPYGQRIKAARVGRGWSQHRLGAEVAPLLGRSQASVAASISVLERSDGRGSPELREALDRVLELDSSSPSSEAAASGETRADDQVEDTNNHSEVTMTVHEAGAGGAGATEERPPLVAALADELITTGPAGATNGEGADGRVHGGGGPGDGADGDPGEHAARDEGACGVDAGPDRERGRTRDGAPRGPAGAGERPGAPVPVDEERRAGVEADRVAPLGVVEEEASTAVLTEIGAAAAAAEAALPKPPPVPVFRPGGTNAHPEELPHEVPPVPVSASAPDPVLALIREAIDRIGAETERLMNGQVRILDRLYDVERVAHPPIDLRPLVEEQIRPLSDRFDALDRRLDLIDEHRVASDRELEAAEEELEEIGEDLTRVDLRATDRLLDLLEVPDDQPRLWRLGFAAGRLGGRS